MENFSKNQIKTVAAFIILISALIIYSIIHSIFGFFQTSSSPSKRNLYINQSMSLFFNKDISNGDDIIKNTKIDNSAFVAIIVEKNEIRFTPISVYKSNYKYKITIPKIVSKNGKVINNHTVKFSTKDKATNDEHVEQVEIDAFILKKYPGLEDLTDGSEADYTVMYGFEEERITLFADIQPYLPPEKRLIQSEMNNKIIEINNIFLKQLKDLGLNKDDFYIKYTPDDVKDIINGKTPVYYDPYL